MSTSTETVFDRFERYPFDSDPIFQNGLSSIITPLEGKPPEVLDETIGKAKAFYFSRSSGEQINWSEYVTYRLQKAQSQPQSHTQSSEQPDSITGPPIDSSVPAHTLSTNTPGDSSLASGDTGPPADTASDLHGASPPLSFSNIADLIVSGQTHLIPNNDIIPDKLSDDRPSESLAPIRKKPWEKDTPSVASEGASPLPVSPAPTLE